MKLFLISALLFLSLFSSCKKRDQSNNIEEARELFNNSVELIHETIEKINLSQDSLMVDSLQKDFEKRIVEINFSFPPETDLKLTEEENDSLFSLMKEMRQLTDKKLEDLSISIPDSIPEITVK